MKRAKQATKHQDEFRRVVVDGKEYYEFDWVVPTSLSKRLNAYCAKKHVSKEVVLGRAMRAFGKAKAVAA